MILGLYLLFTLCIAISYVGLIIYILKQWRKNNLLPEELPTGHFSYSIIIPARNEEGNIAACLDSILGINTLSKISMEVIVVDDHSTDKTVEEILKLDCENLSVLYLEDYLEGKKTNSYKKEAINYALERATGDYIIQTDADCIFNSNYLTTLDNLLHQHQPDFVACPVLLHPAHGLLEHFQVLDLIGMMGLTHSGITSGNWHIANGANMVYRKQEGKLKDLSLASGDDVLRIESMAKNPSNKILFLKDENLIVKSRPLASLSDLIAQRLRWGTKNRKTKNSAMRWIIIIVYLNALFICIHPFLTLAFGPAAIILFITHLLLKMSIDYIYLREISEFFNTRSSLKYFIPASIMTILYISVVGTLSLFITNYQWKGRSVR